MLVSSEQWIASVLFFFFQAEDGIRDYDVTGVQTCALPISGYSRNMTYPLAWRYRNYVIRAFNADKPFDQFVREQVAGDLLPFKSPAQRDEQVMATAFLTIGAKTLNESNLEQFNYNVADDQIDATSRAFLAMTTACARCHDHKFDPIPTRDYYAMAGIFLSSKNQIGRASCRERV